MTTEIRYYMNKFTSGWLKNETLLLEPCDLNELSKLLSRAELNEARIAELEAEREWIPVSVRLPECEKEDGAQSDRVACLTNLFERTIGWVDWNTYEKGYTWDWVKDTIYGYSDEIIAWYPLPPVKVQS